MTGLRKERRNEVSMKFRNIAIGVVVGGVIFAGGVAAVAWQ